MKKILFVAFIASVGMGAYSFVNPTPKVADKDGIHWMSWSEMQEAQKKEPRKVVVDVYTSWCGWCKRMEATTFTNPVIIKYVNDNFYAVKFDAETHDVIHFNGHDYKYVSQGNSGYNELAAQILNGQLSYPTSVYFDESLSELAADPGYKDAKTFEAILNFVASNSYKNSKFEDYQKGFAGKVK